MANTVKVIIEGREVTFKASGFSPVAYNMLFPGHDYMKDFTAIQSDTSENGGLSLENYEVFVRLAYLYAYQGLSDSTKVTEEQREFRGKYPDPWDWIDTFGTFSLYEVLPEIAKLWNLNQTQVASSKNRIPAPPAK